MIFGLETQYPLPEHWTPLEAVAVIKCLDEKGDPTLWMTSTESLNSWERLGMLTAARDITRSQFVPEDD